MVTQDKPRIAPQRLRPDSRATSEQFAFAQLIASGLNSAASCYRQAYKIKSSKEWWTRKKAYELLQKPHIQALVTKFKTQFDSVRPSLTRACKREILHGMAVDDQLDPIDRQRAVDIDNKMQSEYSERLHLTGDLTVSMFRANGAIPWQLAENLPPKDVTPSRSNGSEVIDVNVMTAPDGGKGTLAIADSSQSQPLPSVPADQSIPTPQPSTKDSPARKGTRKLKPVELAALRGTRRRR